LWLPGDSFYKPKHVEATVIILHVLIFHVLIKFVCISWTVKNLILLMRGTTMKIIVYQVGFIYKIILPKYVKAIYIYIYIYIYSSKLKSLHVIPKISVKYIHAHILTENVHYVNPVKTTMNICTLQSYIFKSYLTEKLCILLL
jgi:hypothetical protein